MYGVRALSNVYYNNCIPTFLFAVYAGVGKLFLAVAASTNGFLYYNSVATCSTAPKVPSKPKNAFRTILSESAVLYIISKFHLPTYGTFWRTGSHIRNNDIHNGSVVGLCKLTTYQLLNH